MSMKKSLVTPWGIDPGTFRFVAQCPNSRMGHEIQSAVTRGVNDISKNCFPGGHEEVEGTCIQMY
jgi:hypothetical protein